MTDDRRRCIDCAHLRGGWCGQAKRAGFAGQRVQIGAELARMAHRCPAFDPKKIHNDEKNQ